jgi:hypothetical protein
LPGSRDLSSTLSENHMITVKPHSPNKAGASAVSEQFLISGLFSREFFTRLLCLEHKRAERSGRPYVLVLLQPMMSPAGRPEEILQKLTRVLSRCTRKTDVKGWYGGKATIGVIFTELGSSAAESNLTGLLSKLTDAIYGELSPWESSQVKLSYSMYPERSNAYPRRSMAEECSVRVAKA